MVGIEQHDAAEKKTIALAEKLKKDLEEVGAVAEVAGAVIVVRRDLLFTPESEQDPHAFFGEDRRAVIQAEEDAVDIMVIRQTTTKTSGYHTKTAAVNKVFLFALQEARTLLAG